MVAPASTSWLDPFLADWRPGTGEPREIREPATGRPLLTLAQGTAEDVARAAAAAAAAQPAWAATSYLERARILRRAAEIYEAHRDEFGAWTQRETGAVHGKMHHEQNFTVDEILNAATMPSQPYGSLVPSVTPGRLSMIRRVPVGVIGAITPWNSPSVLGMRVVAPALALGNAVVLKPDPQTPVCGGAMFEAVFREAGLPEGLLHVVVGGADVGEAIVTDPNVDVVSFTGSTAAGRRVGELAGRAAQEGLARARRQQRVRRARRRRPRRGRLRRRLRLVPVPGPGLLRGRAPHRPPQRRRATTSRRSSRRRAPAARRPVPRGRGPRADRQREAARARGRHRPAVGRGRRAARRRRHPRGPVLPADRARRRHHATCRPGPTRSSARSPRSSSSTRTRRRSRSRTTASTASPAPSTRARSRAASRSRSGSGAAWSTSTTRP